MSTKQNIVVLYSGNKITPFVRYLLDSRKLKFTLIANSLLDYKVSSDPNNKDSAGGWVDMELLSIASTIVSDDLRQSPLASLFTKSKMISVVPLSASGQFMATWLSEIRSNPETAHEETHKIFKTLANYNSYPVNVYPLSYAQARPISIKYRNQTGSPRVYHNFGYLDFQKRTEIDHESLESAIGKKDFSIVDYEPKESVISAEIEKIIKDADSIIISSDDFFSLAIMLSYQDVKKSIKKSQGSVLCVSPVGARLNIDQKEAVLSKAFGFSPDINGFFDLLKGIADTVCLDSGDSDLVVKAQEMGFNVVLDDLLEVEDKNEYLSLILKGAGVDISGLNLGEAVGISKNSTEPGSKQVEIPPIVKAKTQSKKNKESPDTEDKSKTKLETSVTSSDKKKINNGNVLQQKTEDQTPHSEKDTAQNSKIEKSINIAKSVKPTTDAKDDHKPNTSVKAEQSHSVPQEDEESILEKGFLEEEDLTEFFNNSIVSLEEDKIEDLPAWLSNIESYIEKDEGHAIKVANALIGILKKTSKEKIRQTCIHVFLVLSKERKIEFKNGLLLWIKSHLDDPDFSIQNFQFDVIRRMILHEVNANEVLGELLNSLIRELLTSEEMTSAKQERGRFLALRIAFNNKTLTKYAIRAYLDVFDDENVSHTNLWPGLSSFSARMVGIELVEGYTVSKSRRIADEAKQILGLGSFSKVLDQIVLAWEKSDMNQVLSLCGSLSESAIRKAKRVSIAQNIMKVGTIPLEILARSLKEDPKELETLVYEMVMNDDIKAKLEIVDGRLYIIPFDIEKETKVGKDINGDKGSKETKQDDEANQTTKVTENDEKDLKSDEPREKVGKEEIESKSKNRSVKTQKEPEPEPDLEK